MARKIRFPLEMKDGVNVRTLKELQENFDAEKLVAYWITKRLQIWLSDRNYINQLEKVNAIKDSSDNVINELCNALGIELKAVEFKLGINEIGKKQEKIKFIRQYTDSKSVLDNVDKIAFNQQEFDKLIKENIKTIYLYGDVFNFDCTIKNRIITGINMPVVKINRDEFVDFDENQVTFVNIEFNKEYQNIVRHFEENLKCNNDKKRKSYKPSELLDFRLSDEDREKCKKNHLILEDEMITTEYDIDVGTRNIVEILEKEDFTMCFSVDNFGIKQKMCLIEGNIDEIYYNFMDRI